MIDRDYVAQQIEKLCEHGSLKEQLEKRAGDYVNIPELAAHIIDAEKKAYAESEHSPGASYAHMWFHILLPFIMSCLLSAPAADVAPLVHGRWEEIRDPYGKIEGWLCKCGREVMGKYNYCPNCGAKMDKEDT